MILIMNRLCFIREGKKCVDDNNSKTSIASAYTLENPSSYVQHINSLSVHLIRNGDRLESSLEHGTIEFFHGLSLYLCLTGTVGSLRTCRSCRVNTNVVISHTNIIT